MIIGGDRRALPARAPNVNCATATEAAPQLPRARGQLAEHFRTPSLEEFEACRLLQQHPRKVDPTLRQEQQQQRSREHRTPNCSVV